MISTRSLYLFLTPRPLFLRLTHRAGISPPYLPMKESLPFPLSFFTSGASYILTPVPSIRFSCSEVPNRLSRYLGENLESKSPARLMLNGLETIYPFRSRAVRAPSRRSLPFFPRARKRVCVTCHRRHCREREREKERTLYGDVSGILGRRYRAAFKTFRDVARQLEYRPPCPAPFVADI